jgi:hypothetical protein
MARPGGRKQDAASPLSPFAAVKDTKHDKALAIPSVLKDVFGFQDLQNNLPIGSLPSIGRPSSGYRDNAWAFSMIARATIDERNGRSA